MTDCSSIDVNKPRIHLSLNQAGVIILYGSGVIYQNQTGGYACAQRCEEGVLLLPTDPELVQGLDIELYQCPVEKGLRDMGWGMVALGIDEMRASQIDALLNSYGSTLGLSVDRSRLKDSEEAWVYVTVEPLENGFYTGFGSCKGVLVWPNSD